MPVSADLENAFADEPARVAETVSLAIGTGLAGCSVEDFTGRADAPIYDMALAVERVAAAAEAAHHGAIHFVLTARAENHIHGRPDLADTIARLQAYGAAGADVLYAPGLTRLEDIRQLVSEVEQPVNVLALPGSPSVSALGRHRGRSDLGREARSPSQPSARRGGGSRAARGRHVRVLDRSDGRRGCCPCGFSMSDFPLEFEVVEEAEDSAFTALQALVPRFDLTTSGSQKIRRTWLDTFDWRLYRAGLVLEHSETAGQHRLTMTSETGERLSSAVASIRWPSSRRTAARRLGFVIALDSVAGIRALLPVAEARSNVQEVRVLNGDAKTVARVLLDRPTLPGHSAKSSTAHLSVVPVRGYDSQGDRVARILSRAPGVQASRGSVYEQALAAAGREPGDYVSKVDIPLSPSMPAALAVATVLETFLGTLEANLSGVIADIDTEFLHDFRVAVRRTRATLKLTGDVLPRLDGGPVRAGVQVARRSDDPDPRPRRVPAGVRRDGWRPPSGRCR